MGYSLLGNAYQKCLSNGSWNGTQPVCQKMAKPSLGKVLNMHTLLHNIEFTSYCASVGLYIGAAAVTLVLVTVAILLVCYCRSLTMSRAVTPRFQKTQSFSLSAVTGQ